MNDFLTIPGLVGHFDTLGYDVIEMVLADQEGWDRYIAATWLTMRRWLVNNSHDEHASYVRTELTASPKRHFSCTRDYLGWGVFALMVR